MAVKGPGPTNINLPPGIVAPLFHATYRIVMPHLVKLSLLTPAVLALDETTAAWSPPTSIFVGAAGFHVDSQAAIQVGRSPAFIYHLSPPATDPTAAEATVIAVVWHVGPVSLQLTAVRGGTFPLRFSPQASVPVAPGAPTGGPPADPALGTLTSWAGASDAAALAVARSVNPYTGCESKS